MEIERDGIVVFGSDFTIRAFSAFVEIHDGDGDGGARSLACAALKTRADLFRGILFRSQDGAAVFHELAQVGSP